MENYIGTKTAKFGFKGGRGGAESAQCCAVLELIDVFTVEIDSYLGTAAEPMVQFGGTEMGTIEAVAAVIPLTIHTADAADILTASSRARDKAPRFLDAHIQAPT